MSAPLAPLARASVAPPDASGVHLHALDGLRGVAVLLVVAFHARAALPGGYLGVDVFFVLSGYLITSLLVTEHTRSGSIDLRRFWIRRARRLLPALFVLLGAVAIYARFAIAGPDVAAVRKDALATLAYVANWRAIYSGKSYWELFADPSPLEHTWSLAIEEQFYVGWPLVVALLLGRRTPEGTRRLGRVSLALAAASAVAMALLYDAERTARAYMGSDTRAAAILLGAALATILPLDARPLSERAFASPGVDRGRSPRVAFGPSGALLLDAAALVSTLVLAWLAVTLDGQRAFLYRGGFWLTEIATVTIIAAIVLVPRGVVARALAFSALRAIGVVSYGVYLWHWPVFVAITDERLLVLGLTGGAPRLLADGLRIGVTVAIALLSYRFVERPIRRHGIRFGSPRIVVPLAFAVTLLALTIGIGPGARIAEGRAAAPLPVASLDGGAPLPDPRAFPSAALPPASELPPQTLRVLVLGDSVGRYLGDAMRLEQRSESSFVGQRGVGACSIHEAAVTVVNGQKVEGSSCSRDWIDDVHELHPDVTLITLGGGFLGPRTCKADWRKAYHDRLRFLLQAMGTDAGLVVLALVPYPGERWRSEGMLDLVDCFNAELASVAAAEAIPTLDLMGHVCPPPRGACVQTSDGWPVRHDGLHFDGPGAAETARWTLGELRRLAWRSPAPAAASSPSRAIDPQGASPHAR